MGMIETVNIWKTYVIGVGNSAALSWVSIQIERGEYVAIMGPSGSGRSTAHKISIGCLDTPSKGSYLLHQEALASLERSRRAAREELRGFLDAIVRANEPTVVSEGTFDELVGINARTFVDFEGVGQPLLGDEELRYLMIDKGNLDERSGVRSSRTSRTRTAFSSRFRGRGNCAAFPASRSVTTRS